MHDLSSMPVPGGQAFSFSHGTDGVQLFLQNLTVLPSPPHALCGATSVQWKHATRTRRHYSDATGTIIATQHEPIATQQALL